MAYERAADRQTDDVEGPYANDIVARGMAQWRTERPDIDCSGKAVVGRILRLQDPILRHVDAALRRHGLRYHSYAVLATLRASGAPFCMSPSQLRETLLLTSGGTSNLLARIERKGWIRRRSGPTDGRSVIVELTEQGRRLADAAMADHAQVERRLVEMFSAGEREMLAAMLSRMLVANSPQEGLQAPVPPARSERNGVHAPPGTTAGEERQ